MLGRYEGCVLKFWTYVRRKRKLCEARLSTNTPLDQHALNMCAACWGLIYVLVHEASAREIRPYTYIHMTRDSITQV